jgi:hypothetical protein
VKQPQEKDASNAPPATGRRPNYVIVTWVSAQLRERGQRNGIALADVLQRSKEQDRDHTELRQHDREAE